MNGIIFGGKHSYDDFSLLLIKKEINPPAPKIHRVDVPMRSGSIDLTEYLNSDVKYEDRKISLTFKMIEPVDTWNAKISSLENFLHGKLLDIVFEDDIMFYYRGRVSVNKWTSDRNIGTIEMECVCDPYKYDIGSNWLWDPFNFDEDIITEINDINVDGTASLTINARRPNTYPIIISDAEMTVEFGGKSYDVAIGKNKIYDILLDVGENTLTFNGHGIITIDYVGGSL